MKKSISVAAVISICAASSAMASGYRIPEQSLDSTAKSGANIASASSADTTYFNPAAMGFMEDTWYVEGTATYLHLTSMEYDDDRSPLFDGSSEKEHFLLPTVFVVSPDYNSFRFGFSFTPSYGLAKRWKDDIYPRASGEEASLEVFEFNPTISYTFSEKFAIGGGIRMIYADATLKNNPIGLATALGSADPTDYTAMKLTGDTVEWGYNLAVDFKPDDQWNFALTYRSNIDLDFDDGDVTFFNSFAGESKVDGSTTLPAPAVLAFSAAYTWEEWTFDLTVDRTFWSEYEDLTLTFEGLGNRVVEKDWDDSTAIRLGVEYRLDPRFTLMGGIAYDENPVPNDHLGFELPDSDAWLFSCGVRYQQSENMEYGVALLYDYKTNRGVNQGADVSDINGDFTNSSAILVSLGMSYKF